MGSHLRNFPHKPVSTAFAVAFGIEGVLQNFLLNEIQWTRLSRACLIQIVMLIWVQVLYYRPE